MNKLQIYLSDGVKVRKQIDSDVVLGIIKSSIDNDYYKSDFDDETIGKAVVSGIRKEVENY